MYLIAVSDGFGFGYTVVVSDRRQGNKTNTIMFKKRKNANIRQRRLSEEDVTGETDIMGVITTDDSNSNTVPAVKKEKKKVKKEADANKKQSVLSFEDELEGLFINSLSHLTIFICTDFSFRLYYPLMVSQGVLGLPELT